MMLVAERHGLGVTHVAGDIERRLGAQRRIFGQPLEMLIGEVLTAELLILLDSEALGGFVGQLHTSGGELLDVTVVPSGAYVIVELETATTDGLSASRLIDRLAGAAAAFERTSSVTSLCEKAAVEFRRLTGFDRVMIYGFLDDDAGKVVAEDRREGLHSFLHHHFPASDIPRQARALYVRNLLRVIPDVSYEPVALRPEWTAPEPLDMSDSSLRSVSPVHLVYLKNMGVQASASFSIINDGVLWGLVACHNETPRLLTYDVRASCRSLVGNLARQIKSKQEAEGYRQRLRLRSFDDDIVSLLSREGSLGPALSNHLNEIGRMMEGTGIAVLRGRELVPRHSGSDSLMTSG
jgi:chemotaxis family two-component system sensor kinase Cph1